MGAAVAKWLSSWLAEQEDRDFIPGLATWVLIGYLLLPSRDMAERSLNRIDPQNNQPTNQDEEMKNFSKATVSETLPASQNKFWH